MIFMIDSDSSLQMPSSAKKGGYSFADLNAGTSIVSVSVEEDAETATYFLTGSSQFDRIVVRFDQRGDVYETGVIRYYKGAVEVYTVWDSFFGATLEQLQSGEILGRDFDPDMQFLGGPNRDVFYGLDGYNEVFGRGGNDLVTGGRGDDVVFGGGDKDDVRGGPGNDVVSGADYWRGDGAKDKLIGNGGSDIFYFRADCGTDTIKDFSRKRDTIQIESDLATRYEDVKQAAHAYHKGVLLKFSGDEKIKIEGLKLAKLEKVSFEFHDFDIY